MLIRFRVENYKSFNGEQELSMVPGESRDHQDHVYSIKGESALRTAVVFGANASGKTNMVRAMAASRNFILGFPFKSEDYCRVSESNRSKPTGFEYTIEINNRIFIYGLEVNLSNGTVESEWLSELHGSRPTRIFHREKNNIHTDLNLNQEDNMFFKVYTAEANVNRNMTFMLIFSRTPINPKSQLSSIRMVLDWFSQSLRIVAAGTAPFNRTKKINDFIDRSIARYGTGITSVKYKKLAPSVYSQMISSDFVYSLVAANKQNKAGAYSTVRLPNGIFTISMAPDGSPVVSKMVYEHDGVMFEYDEESDGTNRLMELLPVLDDSDVKGITYVIDELDRSLHPQLTQKFVRDFEALPSALKRQLIITTHESRLMDLELLRRDEIWFVSKDKDGSSELYSLEEFRERKDRKIDKSYLEGRYGGVPSFMDVFPNLE